MNKQNVLKYAKFYAIQAGCIILNMYRTDFKVEIKADKLPITIADKQANNTIVSGMKINFPKVAILSEESRDDKSRLDNDYCLIVDPLDGTKEFINKNGQFTVNIALAYKNKVVLGVIYVPVKKELYYAVENYGAYLENVDSGKVKRIQVTENLKDLIIVGSKSHASNKEAKLIEDNKDKIKDTLIVGSSLKGCMVASGKADVYYRFGYTCEWDTAAMQCIVEEAGGIFRQMDGTEMLYNRENTLNEKGFYIVNRKENVWV